jgi:hypothetical protein
LFSRRIIQQKQEFRPDMEGRLRNKSQALWKQTMKKQGPSLDTLPEMWLRNKPEFPKILLTERRVATDKLIRRYEHICLAKVRVELVFDSSGGRDLFLQRV